MTSRDQAQVGHPQERGDAITPCRSAAWPGELGPGLVGPPSWASPSPFVSYGGGQRVRKQSAAHRVEGLDEPTQLRFVLRW